MCHPTGTRTDSPTNPHARHDARRQANPEKHERPHQNHKSIVRIIVRYIVIAQAILQLIASLLEALGFLYAFALTFILLHEAGHLLARKYFGWPTIGLRVPRKATRWHTFRLGSTLCEVALNPITWRSVDGITLPWPPDNLTRIPRYQKITVLLAGNASSALLALSTTAIAARSATTALQTFAIATQAIAAAEFSLNHLCLFARRTDTDGWWFWRTILGRDPTSIERKMLFIAALILTGIFATRLFREII